MRKLVCVGAIFTAGLLSASATRSMADATSGPESAVLSEWKALCFDTNSDWDRVGAVAASRGWTPDTFMTWRKKVEPYGMIVLTTASYSGAIYRTVAVTQACGLRFKHPSRDLAGQVSALLGSAPGEVDTASRDPSSTWYFQTVQDVRTPVSAPEGGDGEGSFDALVALAPVTIVTLRREGRDTVLIFSFTYKDTRPPQ